MFLQKINWNKIKEVQLPTYFVAKGPDKEESFVHKEGDAHIPKHNIYKSIGNVYKFGCSESLKLLIRF